MSGERLLLSSPEDLADMCRDRARHDAILVGAETVRRDDPSLLLKDRALQDARVNSARPPHPIRVTITQSGELPIDARFFGGEAQSVVLCASPAAEPLQARLDGRARVVPLSTMRAEDIVRALKSVGIESVFVEGGMSILTLFLGSGLFHDLRLAVAPFFVGDSRAPRVVGNAEFFNNKNNRLELTAVQALGDTAVLRYKNARANEVFARYSIS